MWLFGCNICMWIMWIMLWIGIRFFMWKKSTWCRGRITFGMRITRRSMHVIEWHLSTILYMTTSYAHISYPIPSHPPFPSHPILWHRNRKLTWRDMIVPNDWWMFTWSYIWMFWTWWCWYRINIIHRYSGGTIIFIMWMRWMTRPIRCWSHENIGHDEKDETE